jgi:hypothetical protein
MFEDTKGVTKSRYSKEGQIIQWPKERRTDNTMAKRKKDRQYNGQKKEGQTIQWPKDRRTDNTMAKRKTTNNEVMNKYQLIFSILDLFYFENQNHLSTFSNSHTVSIFQMFRFIAKCQVNV